MRPRVWADVAKTPAPATPVGEQAARDAALLEQLEMLLDLELLESWDPGEDMPIPVEDARDPEKPR